MNEVSNEKPHLTPAGKFALLLIGGEVAVFALVALLFTAELALGACICLAIVATVIWSRWSDHTEKLFWVMAVIGVLLQWPLIRYLPWGDRSYRPLFMPLAICDYVAVWIVIRCGVVMAKNKIETKD